LERGEEMNLKKIIAVILAVSFLLTAAVACEKEGTAEKAGKEIDRAFDSAKEKFNEATK
jgi:predicted small secreted protein